MKKNSLIDQIADLISEIKNDGRAYQINPATARDFFAPAGPLQATAPPKNDIKQPHTPKALEATQSSINQELTTKVPSSQKAQKTEQRVQSSPKITLDSHTAEREVPQQVQAIPILTNSKPLADSSLTELHKLCSPDNRQNQALNPKADLFIVDEFNRAHSSPFEGETGEMFKKMILAMGFSDLDQVYLARVEVVKKLTPPERIEQLKNALIDQIKRVEPKVIICMGKSPLSLLCGINAIQQVRGQEQTLDGIPLIPTLPPLFIQRQEEQDKLRYRKLVWSDLKQAMKILADA